MNQYWLKANFYYIFLFTKQSKNNTGYIFFLSYKRIISDTAIKDRRRNSVQSYHEYEEVESLTSSQCSHLNADQAYENSEDDVTADKCYINEVGFHMYEDLDHDTRSELREYNWCV